MKRFIVLFILLFIAFIIARSGPESKKTPAREKAKGVLTETSELIMLMRKMEVHMLKIRMELEQGKTVRDSANYNPEEIFTVRASPHVNRDENYMNLGKQFMKNYHKLIAESNVDSAKVYYTQTINSCVSCHGSYCPGPIMRISKLHIRNR